MRRVKKTAAEVRREVALMIRHEANVAGNMGDPEGEGRLRDIARDIERLRLTKDRS